MHTVYTHNGWRVHALRTESETRALMDVICRNQGRSALKEDHNSSVYRIKHNGEDLVVKWPTARNRRYAERVRTLFRPGKAMRMWQGMRTLRELGFNVPEPLCTAYRRQAGMIVDSLLVYHYVEGKPVTDADGPAIDTILTRLHTAGYLRHDAALHNYLRVGNRIFMIDTTLHRPRLFKRTRFLLEHLALHRSHPKRWLAHYEGSVPAWQLNALLGLRQTLDTMRTYRRALKTAITRDSRTAG